MSAKVGYTAAMADSKGLSAKFLGLFVESGDGEASASVSEAPEVLRGPAPVLEEERGAVSASVVPANVDFDEVFKTVVDATDLDSVHKAVALLKSLPDSAPLEVRRGIVAASLKAFGFDTQKIVDAGRNQLKAIATFVRVNEQQLVKATAENTTQVAKLEAALASMKQDLARRSEHLASVVAAADLRSAEVHEVLKFFGAEADPPKTSPQS